MAYKAVDNIIIENARIIDVYKRQLVFFAFIAIPLFFAKENWIY